MLDVLYEPAKIIQLLANSLPQGANFFLNYILFNSATHGMELIQLGSQLFGHLIFTLPVFSKTPRMLARYTSPWSFPYYYYYPNHILILVITVTYSVIQPLILIFALFYFSVALVVYRHQYAFCYIRKFESGGSRHYRRMARYTSDGLLIFQLTMVGLLYLKGVLSAATAILPLIVFTIWMKVKLTRLFGQRAKYPFVGQLNSPTATAATSPLVDANGDGMDKKNKNGRNSISLAFRQSQNRLSTEIMAHKSSSSMPTSLASKTIFFFSLWVDDVWKFSYLQSWWKHGRYATQTEQNHWAYMAFKQRHRPSSTYTVDPSKHQESNTGHCFTALNMKSLEKTAIDNPKTPTTTTHHPQQYQDYQIPDWDTHYHNDGYSLYNEYTHPSIMTPLDHRLFLPKDPTLRKWNLAQCTLVSLVDLQDAFDRVSDSGSLSV